MDDKKIRLSVLIPAYEYAEGVERILSSFLHDPFNELEIIISDDSVDDRVNKIVDDFSLQYLGNLKYRRNRPGLGAVSNWNSLLSLASGEYIILLHHDEFPLEKGFSIRVLEMLKNTPEVDVFVMDCILLYTNSSISRPHLPQKIRSLVFNYFPSYLFKRNVIGPTSCMIVRRLLHPGFDERLRWLVDVEAYFRLRLNTSRWHLCHGLKIGSTLGRKDSITSSIKNDLNKIDESERSYLLNKYPVAEVWLSPHLYRCVHKLENISWLTMRIVTIVWYIFFYLFRFTYFPAVYLQRIIKNDHH